MEKKLLRKVFVITLTILIIITICTIPTIGNKNVLRTNLEIEDITNLNTNNIYLLNKDNLLVRVEVFISNTNLEEQVKGIINYLTINNRNIPSGLKGYLERVKVLKINKNNDVLEIDFSKELQEDEITITGIVYSLIEIKDINKVKITKEGLKLKDYPEVIDQKIGINNKYLFHTRKDLNRVVIYYLDNINNSYYFVPITKYLNDNRNKIEVIVEELKSNTELISVIDYQVKLLDYKEEENVLFLNFNKYLKEDKNVTNRALDEIAYSVFASYDVNMVMFEVNGKKLDYRKRD